MRAALGFTMCAFNVVFLHFGNQRCRLRDVIKENGQYHQVRINHIVRLGSAWFRRKTEKDPSALPYLAGSTCNCQPWSLILQPIVRKYNNHRCEIMMIDFQPTGRVRELRQPEIHEDANPGNYMKSASTIHP